MSQTRIMVVEDEPTTLTDALSVLPKSDYLLVGSALGCEAALELAGREHPDLVLIDISSDKDLDGIGAARIISEQHHFPVLLITTLKDESLVVEAQKTSAFGLVTKPFDRITISNAIQLTLYRCGMEKELHESEERFRIFAEYTHDWEYWLSPKRKPVYHSPSCLRITGYTADEFMDNPDLLVEIVHPEDADMVEEHVLKACATSWSAADIDFRIVTRQGEMRWINHVCQPVNNKTGRFRGRRAGNRDITDRKQLEIKLEHMAIHDGLTGLPNRELLVDRLEHAIASASRKMGKMAVLFIDIDDFKAINDNFGHKVGDLVLKEVADRVQASVRQSDTVARFGGDEFVVVLSEVTEPEDARSFARKISQVLTAEFESAGQCFALRASIGGAIFPDHGETSEQLIAKADAAMYKVKLGGKQGIEIASLK